MIRVLCGFLSAPLPFVLAFGALAQLGAAFIYGITIIVAVPLFLIFKRYGWLSWGHSLLAGLVTAALFAFLYGVTASWYHTLFYGPSNTTTFLGIGAAIGILFWFVALYRNQSFPRPEPNWLLLISTVASLGICGYSYRQAVVAELVIATAIEPPADHSLRVALTSGAEVKAEVIEDLASRITEGRRVLLTTRKTVFLIGERSWVIGCESHPSCY